MSSFKFKNRDHMINCVFHFAFMRKCPFKNLDNKLCNQNKYKVCSSVFLLTIYSKHGNALKKTQTNITGLNLLKSYLRMRRVLSFLVN